MQQFVQSKVESGVVAVGVLPLRDAGLLQLGALLRPVDQNLPGRRAIQDATRAGSVPGMCVRRGAARHVAGRRARAAGPNDQTARRHQVRRGGSARRQGPRRRVSRRRSGHRGQLGMPPLQSIYQLPIFINC